MIDPQVRLASPSDAGAETGAPILLEAEELRDRDFEHTVHADRQAVRGAGRNPVSLQAEHLRKRPRSIQMSEITGQTDAGGHCFSK